MSSRATLYLFILSYQQPQKYYVQKTRALTSKKYVPEQGENVPKLWKEHNIF